MYDPKTVLKGTLEKAKLEKPALWLARLGVGNYNPPAKSGPLPVFANKVLLEHSHTRNVYIFAMAAFTLQQT